MKKTVKYSRALQRAITPELKRRIEIIAQEYKMTYVDTIVFLLGMGASTPKMLGAGVSTLTKKQINGV